MSDIDWRKVWDSAVNNNRLFPAKRLNNSVLSVSCPTRFSASGKVSIEVTPTFNKTSISLAMLLINDNVDIQDILSSEQIKGGIKKVRAAIDLNKVSDIFIQYEISNRILDRFLIESNGFNSEKEAEDTLIDYINSKATESGRMFDDTLDELSAHLSKGQPITAESIRHNRAVILRKVESILRKRYCWAALKSEDYSDSVVSCYDKNNRLVAVISLVDDHVMVDLAKGICAVVSLLQSDEAIENELCTDVDSARDVISSVEAEKEVDSLKDTLAGSLTSNNSDTYRAPVEPDDDEGYLEDLEKRLTQLENRFINRRLKRLY